MPIGNGRMGTLVWTTPASVAFQINRVDVFAVNRNTGGRHFPGSTDYCGGCSEMRVSTGGEPFVPGKAFRQSLSLQTAQCTVTGKGVTVTCYVAAQDDVLIVTVTDERREPEPIEVTLGMWREPEVREGGHSAAYSFRQTAENISVVQTFRETDHYCSSAVAVSSPGNDACIVGVSANSRTLSLPPAFGTRTILVSSAASMDENNDVCADAEGILATLSASDAVSAAEERHIRWWHAFWERSFVEIKSTDGRGEQAARDRLLFLYHMASSSRGAFPPKWNGSIFSTEGDTRAWGSQFWLWTTEMLYWPLHAADAGDLAAPFFAMYRSALPAMENAALQRWNAKGMFLPETMPFDGPTALPASLVEPYRDRLLHNPHDSEVSADLVAHCEYDWHLEASTRRDDRTPDGYSWISHVTSSGAELAVHAWWRYRFTGDRHWLLTYAYPLLHGVAEFYRGLARRGADGYWHMHRTNAHEDFWGVTDSIMDLAAIRGVLPLAIHAAEQLDLDVDLRAEWQQFLHGLAPYPMGHDGRARALTDGALADDAWAAGYLDAVNGSHNVGDVQLSPIFPFEDWTIETRDPSMDTIARSTLERVPLHQHVLAGGALKTAIRTPIAAVRTGAGEKLPEILQRYRAAFAPLPNGFSLFEGSTAHSVEHLGLLTLTLQEALLQSVAPTPGSPEVMNVFPAWPKKWDVSFRLLARGGFLVSASMRGGAIGPIDIESRLGEACRVRNPWPHPCRVETGDGKVYKNMDITDGMIRLSTRPGGRYRLLAEKNENDDNGGLGASELSEADDAS
ncbi:MAG: hypothetical protein HOH43_22235 [Candidatus Latescibacteria bacterium]|nr:hypothetical protein [Candidatus Latescibacterota bacterium]